MVSVRIGGIGNARRLTIDVSAGGPTRDAASKAAFESNDVIADVLEGAARPCAVTALLKGVRAGRCSCPSSRPGRPNEGNPNLSAVGKIPSSRVVGQCPV